MYQSYADADYYEETYGGSVIPEDEIQTVLKNASRHIDILTYNRIIGRGFDNLTEYQQELIKEINCEMAEFEYENKDLINTVLKSYSINGVSMSFGESWNISVNNGIAVKREYYAKLCSTGLCSRIVR